MIPPPLHPQEEKRMQALEELGLLDTEPEERFDRITKKAVKELHAPISTITLIDKDREWFKSCEGLDMKESPRNISFCGHAMLADDVFIVEDTLKDERFRDNPSVVGAPYIRFYAGAALYDRKTNLPVGVFCIKDTRPRMMDSVEIAKLLELASEAEKEINIPSV